MKRVLLICPASPDDMPYLRPYLDSLESLNIAYDITYLCGNNERKTFPSNYYSFDASKSFISQNFIRKIYNYYRYSHFVNQKLSKGSYTHIIAMGIACSAFMGNFLIKNFKGKYIYDIRDYSQVLRFPLFKCLNEKLLRFICLNFIPYRRITNGGVKVLLSGQMWLKQNHYLKAIFNLIFHPNWDFMIFDWLKQERNRRF